VKAKLEEEYEMSDLKKLYFCLGVEFEKDWIAHTITISQREYIEGVI